MKKLIVHIVFVLLTGSVMFAQSTDQQTPKEQQEKKEKTAPAQIEGAGQEATAKTEEPKNEAVDLLEPNSKRNANRNKASEHFIDKDGDGINDSRCNGFGVQKQNRKGRRCGKK